MAHIDPRRLPIEGRGGLIEVLRRVPDPRKRRGVRHPIASVMAIAVCATLAGAQTVKAIAEWAESLSVRNRRRLWCRRDEVPKATALRQILRTVDVVYMEQLVSDWLAQLLQEEPSLLLKVDSETLNAANGGNKPSFHLVSAVLHRARTALSRRAASDKTNESTTEQPSCNSALPLCS